MKHLVFILFYFSLVPFLLFGQFHQVREINFKIKYQRGLEDVVEFICLVPEEGDPIFMKISPGQYSYKLLGENLPLGKISLFLKFKRRGSWVISVIHNDEEGGFTTEMNNEFTLEKPKKEVILWIAQKEEIAGIFKIKEDEEKAEFLFLLFPEETHFMKKPKPKSMGSCKIIGECNLEWDISDETINCSVREVNSDTICEEFLSSSGYEKKCVRFPLGHGVTFWWLVLNTWSNCNTYCSKSNCCKGEGHLWIELEFKVTSYVKFRPSCKEDCICLSCGNDKECVCQILKEGLEIHEKHHCEYVREKINETKDLVSEAIRKLCGLSASCPDCGGKIITLTVNNLEKNFSEIVKEIKDSHADENGAQRVQCEFLKEKRCKNCLPWYCSKRR